MEDQRLLILITLVMQIQMMDKDMHIMVLIKLA